MKPRRSALVGLVLAAAVVLAAAAGAGLGAPLGLGSGGGTAYADVITGSWSSAFQVQNLGSGEATVQVTYRNKDGSQAGDVQTVKIAVGRSKTFLPGAPKTDQDPSQQYTDMSVPAGFNGSVQLASDQRVVAIANINSTDYRVADTYGGVTSTSTKVILPIVQKNLSREQWSTAIFVQNATGSQVSGTIVFYHGSGSLAGQEAGRATVSIAPYGSVSFDQDKGEPAAANLPDNWYGSAVISTNVDVAAVVVQSNGQAVVSYPGLTEADSANTIYAPLVQNENDSCSLWSGLQVVNISSVTTDIIAKVGNTEISRRTNIGQYQAGNWLTAASDSGFAGRGTVLATTFVASNPEAKLVGIVNLNRRDVYNCGPKGPNRLTGYPTFASGYRMFTSGAQQAFAPLLDYNNDGWWAGFQVMNVGSAPTNVQLYVNGSPIGSKVPLDPGSSQTYFRPQDYGITTQKLVAGGYVLADSGGQIVGVVNRTRSRVGAENQLTYEAFKP